VGRVTEFLRRISGQGAPSDRRASEHTALFAANIKNFEHLIGYSIRNRDIFVQSLLHRSFLQRLNSPGRSNERLEFLGDSILNLIVAEYLYRHFPDAEEGELTKVRSRLVNRKALAAYAKEIRLTDFILMSPSAADSIGKGYDTITSDTYEAVIAAMYLDGGMDAARRFVERQVIAALRSGSVVTDDENYKSMLLEYAQARGFGVPRYMIVREEGPDHDRTFTVEVMLNSEKKGVGTGKNKKEAEQAAASMALDSLHDPEDAREGNQQNQHV
jgi:ribonuclease-3